MIKQLTLILLIFEFALVKRIEVPVTKIQANLQSEDDQSSLRSLQSISASLSNFQNIQYYGALQIGSSKKKMNFIFDTGSNQLWFPIKECKKCQSGTKRYDTSSSSYFSQKSEQLTQITYVKGEVEGFSCYDQVWFSGTSKIDKMPCIAVVKQSDMKTQAEGIIGIGPSNNPEFPSILTLLKQHRLIDRKVMSIALQKQRAQSSIIFGEPDLSLVTSNSVNATIQMSSSQLLGYSVVITGARIGDREMDAYGFATIDTGTSFISAPLDVVLSLVQYYNEKGAELIPCAEFYCGFCYQIDKSSLVLTLGTQQFYIPFDELWIKKSGMCALGVHTSLLFTWILGDTFIRNYFIIIDQDKEQMTFIGENKVYQYDYTGWLIYALIVLCLGGYIALYYWVKKRGCFSSCRKQAHLEGNGVRIGSSQV